MSIQKNEFLWSEDMADTCVSFMEKIEFKDIVNENIGSLLIRNNNQYTNTQVTNIPITNTHINIGAGKDVSIKELATMIKEIVGYKGELYFNTDKSDGTMIKLTDPSKLHELGWKHEIELKEGIKKIYNWYKGN